MAYGPGMESASPSASAPPLAPGVGTTTSSLAAATSSRLNHLASCTTHPCMQATPHTPPQLQPIGAACLPACPRSHLELLCVDADGGAGGLGDEAHHELAAGATADGPRLAAVIHQATHLNQGRQASQRVGQRDRVPTRLRARFQMSAAD